MIPGRLVFPALRWRPETGFSHEDGPIDEALAFGAGGFIVFGVPGARADEIVRLTEEVRRRAGRPLLLAADLERGAGQQARRLTEIPPPAALASLDDDAVIRWAGATTAREARQLGLDWVFAPVADLDVEPENPIVQTRAFGADPARVARAVVQWVEGCQAEGVMACVKHYPGHGRTTTDSHEGLPAVRASLAELAASDLVPFEAAVRAGVAAVMTAHVAFPAWDPGGAPATLSPVILGHLRDRLGFGGLVVTDAMIMGALGQGDAVPARAVAAGCDLLLYPPRPAEAARGLGLAVEAGVLAEARVRASLDRYEAALRRAAGAVPASAGLASPDAVTSASVARRLLERGWLRGGPPVLSGGYELTIVDDDQGGWYRPGPNDLVRRTLARRGLYERYGGARIVLAFAEPRAAKGRAGFGPEAMAALEAQAPEAALVVLFAHPRLAASIPGNAPLLLAWHRQPLMQEAVAEWIAGRVG